MAILSPDVFIGSKGQDAIMTALNDFLKTVPSGEKIQIEPKTITVLNEIGQALGNMIACEVSKFNKGVAETAISA